MLTTDSKIVVCQVYEKKIGCSMKSQLEQHIRSALHKRNKQHNSSRKQVLLTQMQHEPSASKNIFFKDMCTAMVAANIPWYKVQVPEYRSFLEKYCQRQIPDECTLRKNYLDAYYQEAVEKISEIEDSYIWIAVDETTDIMGRYIANFIVGKLDSEAPTKSFLIASKTLERTNHSTVAQFVNDGLKVLWPNGVQEEKVLVLFSDAAAYMLKAATALKVFYPNLIHFTCLAHALQRVAEEIRSNFPQVNKLISSTKKVFVKAPPRVQQYKQQLPNVPLPPEPVLTRWGTWIEAMNFFTEHFESIKSVVEMFNPESALSVREAQAAFIEPKLECSIAYITSNFGWLPEKITILESSGLSLQKSMDIMEDLKKKLSSVKGEAGISRKFQAVIDRNPGYSTFLSVYKILSGEDVQSPEGISPGKIALMKYSPVTSCDVER